MSANHDLKPGVSSRVSATLGTTRAERQKLAQDKYWAKFKHTHRRVYGTLPKADYRAIEVHAKAEGRTVFQQIWLESCAYREQGYVPSEAVLAELSNLSAEIRRIGNNLNQLAHHSNRFQRFLNDKQAKENLQLLEARLEDAVLKLTNSHI